ncbi:hypothetical protein I316_06932 [Kwoniella heveanensis BCC8398]|uniref:RNase III domain-containing protein n=1 Tax=Kwoniella heveanensis BCC8398 TaxID=1296120 RepID=A0A1B9GK20_9TREE|nr:hypothetical protein I316_06932 [Kwoniella heveanensis BCC8398]
MTSLFATYELPPIPLFSGRNDAGGPLEEPLPPLPPIEDESIETRVFTHASYIGKKRTTGTSLFDNEEEGRDNDKYEHLGDSLLGASVTLLLQDMYPTLSVGMATTLRSLLVANKTLRQLSHLYRLPLRLIAPAEQWAVLANGEHVPANLFEAYIAGVYYSYLQCGRVEAGGGGSGSPLQPMFESGSISSSGPASTSTSAIGLALRRHGDDADADAKPDVSELTSAHDSPSSGLGSSSNGFANGHGTHTPAAPESGRRPTTGEARDYLDQWLRPLFAHLARWALNELKQEQLRMRQRAMQQTNGDGSGSGEDEEMEDAETDRNAIGALARLNEWFIAKEGAPPKFVEEKSGAEWRAECRAVDKDGTVW